MGVDTKVMKGVMAKAKLVMTSKQFLYFQEHYEFDLPIPHIAELHGVAASSVYGALSKAKKRMKKEWG